MVVVVVVAAAAAADAVDKGKEDGGIETILLPPVTVEEFCIACPD